MYDLKYKGLWLGLGVLLAGMIATLSLMPATALPNLYSNDKFFHFFAYFVVSCWFVGLVKVRFYVFLGLIFLAFGYALEILQGMSRYRRFEWYDLLANGLGIVTAILLGLLFLRGWCIWAEKKFLTK